MPGVDYGRRGLTATDKEIVKGVLTPHAYGIETWEMLEQRVVINLTHQLVDLSKVLIARGRREEARAAAREALDLDLTYLAPDKPSRPPRSSPASTPPKEGPLARRALSALSKGWLTATGLCYLSLHPLPRDGRGLRGHRMQLVHSAVWHLLKARHLRASDPAGSAGAARTAFEGLIKVISDRISRARARPMDKSIAAQDEFLGGDPFVPSFPWGWWSVEFGLARLSAYLKEAAQLTGDAAVARKALLHQGRVAAFLMDRRKPGKWARPNWTSEGRLGKPPT